MARFRLVQVTYAGVERAIRSAWAGDVGEAATIVYAVPGAEQVWNQLELLAAAPLASKPAHADAVRGAWIRAGGVAPAVPRPGGISDPLAPQPRYPW